MLTAVTQRNCGCVTSREPGSTSTCDVVMGLSAQHVAARPAQTNAKVTLRVQTMLTMLWDGQFRAETGFAAGQLGYH